MKLTSLFHPASRHASRLALVLAVPLIVGCGKKEAPVIAADTQAALLADAGAAPTAPNPDDTPPEEGNPRRDPEPASDAAAASANTLAAPALGRIPKDAPFLVTARLTEILSALGYSDLLARHSLMLAELAAPMIEVAGHNFFELASWSKIGIDLAAPAGFFGLDYRTNGGVLFLGVSDRKVLESFIIDTAKKAGTEMTVETLGDHSLLSIAGENRGAVLLTDTAVYSINLFAGTGATEIARAIATREVADSILGSEDFKKRSASVASPDGGLYVRVTELLSRPLASSDDTSGLAADIERQLEEAKKADDADLVANLTQTLSQYKEQEAYLAKRMASEQELFNTLTSGMSYVVAGLDISPNGVDLDMRIPLAAGAALTNILKASEGLVPIMKVAGSTPLLSMGGKIDVAGFVELLGLMLATEGGDMAGLREGLKSEFAVDLDADLLANLGGDVGFALTGDLGEVLRSGDPAAALGGTFILGLKNPDALKATFSKLAARPGLSELGTWNEAEATFTGKLPEGQAFVISLKGPWLVASTDTEARGRLDGSASFVDTITNSALKARLSKPGLGAFFQLQPGFAGGWLFLAGGRSMSLPEPESSNEPDEKKKIREELAKLQAEIGPLRAKVEEARMKPFLENLGRLGNFAQTARLGDGALELTMGMYPHNATLAEAVAGLVDYALVESRGAAPTPDEDKLRELENLRWELESKLWRADSRPSAIEPEPSPGD